MAEHLIQLFSKVGIPRDILTEQGTNFMSQLLKELYNLLHVSQIWTSPCHPQTDGLVERFNKTLKLILREEWEASKRSDESVLSHILLVRERLEEMSELVSENLKEA